MGTKFIREVDRFAARSDDGEYETVVVVSQHFIDTATRQDPSAVRPALKEARTAEGFACNFIEDGSFEVVNHPFKPNLIIHRV